MEPLYVSACVLLPQKKYPGIRGSRQYLSDVLTQPKHRDNAAVLSMRMQSSGSDVPFEFLGGPLEQDSTPRLEQLGKGPPPPMKRNKAGHQCGPAWQQGTHLVRMHPSERPRHA